MIALMLVAALAQAEPFFTGEIETVAENRQFTEGPLWLPSGKLAYTDIPANIIYVAGGEPLRDPSGMTNGLALDREGRVVCFEHEGRRVSRIEADGEISMLADRFEGRRFNSPNDGVVRGDGVICFTDPDYGLGDRPREIPYRGVYAIANDGTVHLLRDDFGEPNGIDFSPDETVLYVADSTGNLVRRLQLSPELRVTGDEVFCAVETPDGIRTDSAGNLWVTSAEGVVVFSPEGERLAAKAFPMIPANCTFGGDDAQWLYVTARSSVYRIRTGVKGLP